MGYRYPDAFTFGKKSSDVAGQAVMGTTIREVDIDLIDEHPDNRAVDEAHVAELADSIRRNGLGQLPMVRVSPDDPDRFQHISGWHRILAYERLFDETHDPKYAKIKVNVAQSLDDDTVRNLVYETNYHSLSVAERGRWFQSIADEVSRSRESEGAWKGVRTADAVAEIATERLSGDGTTVSPTAVKRGLKAYRDGLSEEADGASDAPGGGEAQASGRRDGTRAAFERAFRRLSAAASDILEMADDLDGSEYRRAIGKAGAFSEALRDSRRRRGDG